MVRIVLLRPRDPENLGAVARVMKSFGLADWAIAALGTHDLAAARRVAVHAEELLDRPLPRSLGHPGRRGAALARPRAGRARLRLGGSQGHAGGGGGAAGAAGDGATDAELLRIEKALRTALREAGFLAGPERHAIRDRHVTLRRARLSRRDARLRLAALETMSR